MGTSETKVILTILLSCAIHLVSNHGGNHVLFHCTPSINVTKHSKPSIPPVLSYFEFPSLVEMMMKSDKGSKC